MHSLRSKKATGGGGGSDVTPNAVNWSDVYYEGMSGNFYYSERRITGINTSITLRITSETTDGVLVYVTATSGYVVSGDGSSSQDPWYLGFTYLIPGSSDTFTVSNNDYVTFGATGNASDYQIKVFNDSDGGVQLDSFMHLCVNC